MNREFLVEMSKVLASKLPDNYGYLVLAFPFNGEGDARLVYTSNARREDAINLVKEWLLKCGAAEEWMKHIK
jgi:hypothetical protein